MIQYLSVHVRLCDMKAGGAFVGVCQNAYKNLSCAGKDQPWWSTDYNHWLLVERISTSLHACVCFTAYSNGRELPCCPVYQNKLEGYYEGNSVEKSSCAKCHSTFDSHSVRVESLSQEMAKVHCTGAENLQSIAYLAVSYCDMRKQSKR